MGCRGAARAAPTASTPSTARSACLLRAMLRFDGDSHTLQEFRRQHPARAHDDRIVADLGDRAVLFNRHRLRVDLLDVGFHHDLKLAILRSRIDSLAIARLGAVELSRAVGQHNAAAAAGLGNARGGLERAVAAADHQYVLTLVLIRVYQPVDHLGQLLTRHAQLARRTAAANREQHAARWVRALVGFDGKAVAHASDLLDALLIIDLHSGLALGFLPELQQCLLAGLTEIHLADERHGRRCGHHQLAARILIDGATEGFLLDGHAAHTLGLRGQCGRKACGTRTDDDQVEAVITRPALLGDHLDRLPSLFERVADEPHPAELPGDENAGHRPFEAGREDRNVDATPLAAKHQLDGIDRTDRLARAVADAISGTHQYGVPVHDAEDRVVRLLRAGLDARAAANAARVINDRVKRRRLGGAGALPRPDT